MKHLFPLSLVLLGSLILSACGGAPQNFTAGAGPVAQPPASNSAEPASSAPAASAQPASAGPASSLPTPPPNAEVIDNIHNLEDGWGSCSVCAQGTNTTTNYWTAPHQATPSLSGSSREFYIGGPAWSNALWWKTLPGHANATHFIWDFWVYWDANTMANIWTAEFDLWQAAGGKEFMMGSQCNFGNGVWDLWDQKSNKWMPTSTPCKRMKPDTWHHIVWYVERLGSDAYRYNKLVVDGTTYEFNKTYYPSLTDWRDAVGVQWQLDQSATGVDLHMWIDKVKLTMW